jgi:hypothetical protein
MISLTGVIRLLRTLLLGVIFLTLAACGMNAGTTAALETIATPTPLGVVEANAQPTSTPSILPRTVSPLADQVSPLETPLSPLPTPVSIDLPEPVEGMAVVGGELYSIVFDRVIPGTAFYFTRAVGENENIPPTAYTGSDRTKGDVPGQSNAEGRFVVDDVPPGNYFLVVWAPYSWVIALESSDLQTPKLFVFEEGRKYEFGRLYFDWPN